MLERAFLECASPQLSARPCAQVARPSKERSVRLGKKVQAAKEGLRPSSTKKSYGGNEYSSSARDGAGTLPYRHRTPHKASGSGRRGAKGSQLLR